MRGFKVALQFDCQRNVREAQNQIHQPLFGLIELAQGLRVEIRQCVGNLSDHRVVEAEAGDVVADVAAMCAAGSGVGRSEEHTSALQSLMCTSYAVFCLKKKKQTNLVIDHYTVHTEHNNNKNALHPHNKTIQTQCTAYQLILTQNRSKHTVTPTHSTTDL